MRRDLDCNVGNVSFSLTLWVYGVVSFSKVMSQSMIVTLLKGYKWETTCFSTSNATTIT